MSIARFHVPGVVVDRGPVVLPEDEAHHLRDVLRLKAGATMRVFDGAGHEWDGQVADVSRRGVTVELAGRVTPVPEPPVGVTLYAGLLKGDQMDAVVRDATMLGVTAIVPLLSAHVVVPKQASRNASAVARWQRVALASAKQCGRAVLPAVSSPVSFDAVFAGKETDPVVFCVEPAVASVKSDQQWPKPGTARLLIGPEGGWTADEVRTALDRGALPLALGPRTLRAETAPVVALTALWTKWGW